jgi:AraC family transcriptional regulator
MELQTHGARKYPTSASLGSSGELGWSTMSAELRSHPASEMAVVVPRHTEIGLVGIGNDIQTASLHCYLAATLILARLGPT